VFNTLPTNVTLLGPTGFTASGHPYITIDVDNLPRDTPALRVPIELHNPDSDAPSTFFVHPEIGVEVFSGKFDPSAA
jgi:hypothetical protein